MAGVKGAGGPVPKRSAQRRRQNKDSKPDKAKAPPEIVEVPEPSEEWHPTARAWYESLPKSGQAQFYEPSDWQAAWVLAGEITRYLNNPRPSAIMFAHIWSAMTDLLTTEGSRRRVRLEVERTPEPDDSDGDVADLDAYRQRVAG